MKKLVACALLGLGLTQSLVACSDDDDDTGNTAGSAGTSAGANSGGKNNGGSDSGGSAGKTNGGSAGNGGTAGKGGSGGSGGKAGSTNVGGEENGGAGGDTPIGGDTSIGGDGAGGEGGAPTVDPDPVMATSYWLNHYCEAQSAEGLKCEHSVPWITCFDRFYGFVGDGNMTGFCEGDTEENGFAGLVAMIAALDGVATACPDPVVEDWRCDVNGNPQPKDKACRDAEQTRFEAYTACKMAK